MASSYPYLTNVRTVPDSTAPLFTFQGDFFQHVEEHPLCATAEAAHSVTDQKIQQTDDVVESTAVVHRGEEVQSLQGVAQTIEAGDL